MENKKYPNVAVKIIFKCDNRIMMFKHKDGTRDFPGGTMEWGESIMGTLRRELKEELSYELKKEPELFSVYNFVSEDGSRHKVLIQYIQKLRSLPKFESLEHVDFFWLDRKEARSIFDIKTLNRLFKY